MITAFVAALALAQTERPANPSALVSKMLSKVAAAKSMVAKIDLVQTVGGVSVGINTLLQFEKPAKFYLRQVRRSSDPAEALVTSDGVRFSYNAPRTASGARTGERLVESVAQGGRKLTVQDIYAASTSSLIDRSAPLDIAMARLDDLKYVRAQWASLEWGDSPAGSGVFVIRGNWREYGNAPVSARFEMWITPDGDLKLYQLAETISVQNQAPQTVISRWNVDLKLDAKPEPTAFVLKR